MLGTILPGSSGVFANSIGYLTIQDSSVAGSPLTPVPFLPDGTTTGPQNITGGTGTTANNTLYSHTPILAFQANVIANDPMWAGLPARPLFGFYNGRLITMLTGPAAGRTGRIVGYYFNANNLNDYLQVLGFDGAVPNPGDQFLINGRPFSGTGFGYRPLSFVMYGSLTSPLSFNPTRCSMPAIRCSRGPEITWPRQLKPAFNTRYCPIRARRIHAVFLGQWPDELSGSGWARRRQRRLRRSRFPEHAAGDAHLGRRAGG